MKRITCTVTALLLGCLLAAGSGAHGAEEPLPLQPFAYVEDFEQPRELVRWATNGSQEVHFSGITDEKAFSGKHSYKLDVTIREGSYHYFGIRVRVPCSGELKLSGHVWLDSPASGANVGLGYNMSLPPTQHTGCSTFGGVDKASKEWKEISGDLVEAGRRTADGVIATNTTGVQGEDVTPFLDLWGIFVYASPGQRVTIHVDDVRIEGKVPDAAAYEAQGKERFAAARARLGKRIADWRARLAKASDAVRDLPPQDGIGQRILDAAREGIKNVETTLAAIEKRGYTNNSDTDAVEAGLEAAQFAGPALRELAQSRKEGLPFLPYVPRAISNTRILPQSVVVPGRLTREIAMAACPGEYESANFVIQALAPIKGLRLEATDLTNARARIPRDAVDIRVVKCWYQSGIGIGFGNQRLLAPELLLKDDALVRVDTEKKENFVRSTDAAGNHAYLPCSGPDSANLEGARPMDAPVLLPVDIDAGTLKQFWITLKVPGATPPGDYEGSIRLKAEGTPGSTMRLKVRVYPFLLEACPLQHSIYYRGILTPDGKGSVSSEAKSEQQYEAEMRDLAAHGVLYPTIYQAYDEVLLKRALEIRKKAGLAAGPLYTLGLGTGATADPAKLAAYREDFKRTLALAKPLGYTDIYSYGTDEATGEALSIQRAAWKNVQDAGGKTFVACYGGTFEAMGSLLNLAIYAGKPKAEEAAKYHKVGSRIFCYAFPQVGNEEPETYRRNFGLVLWKAGYDGAMDYAYQHSFHHAWNDFDDRTYRDHVFAYPMANGVVDTVQWEGYREAVDDVRYLATLRKAIDTARNAKANTDLITGAEKWLAAVDPQGDLDATRKAAADRIVRLLTVEQ